MVHPSRRLLGIALVLTVTSALVEPLVIARTRRPYSVTDQAISDLGATACGTVPGMHGDVDVCSPWWLVMNGSMVVAGLALAVAGLLLSRTLAIRPGARWAMVVAGLSTLGAGLVPLDVSFTGHVLLALPAFPAQAVLLLLLAGAVGRALSPRWRSLFLAGGLVTGGATLLFAAPASWGLPFGVVERVAAYVAPLLLALLGLRLLRRGSTPVD